MKYIILAGALMMTACDTPTKEPAAPPMNLAGSEWTPGEGTDTFVAFKGDGSVTGHGGCNRFNGTYTQDGANVQIGPLATTRKMCPPDIMNVEQAVLSALQNTKTVEASHLKLTLIGDNGVQLMSLQRTDWD